MGKTSISHARSHARTHAHPYIYIYIYRERERERGYLRKGVIGVIKFIVDSAVLILSELLGVDVKINVQQASISRVTYM